MFFRVYNYICRKFNKAPLRGQIFFYLLLTDIALNNLLGCIVMSDPTMPLYGLYKLCPIALSPHFLIAEIIVLVIYSQIIRKKK